MKKQITAILCLALAVCTVFSCVSCSVRISANEISSGFSRKATEKGTVDSEFTGILSGFSMKLVHRLPQRAGKGSEYSRLPSVGNHLPRNDRGRRRR